jgi:hypothetical protein
MDISMNEIDNITLQYFTNKNQYDSILKQKCVNNNTIYLNERKFYKKRILDLTKKAFRNEVDDNHVKNAFENYIRTCINHLKFSDKKDIYQEQYDGINIIDNHNEIDNIQDISYDNIDYIICKPEDIKKCNLDSFVINKKKKRIPYALPKKPEINIKSAEYKTKGIVKKKKNITNKYEDEKEN